MYQVQEAGVNDLSAAMDLLEHLAVEGAETHNDTSLYKAAVYGALACVREHLEPAIRAKAHAWAIRRLEPGPLDPESQE